MLMRARKGLCCVVGGVLLVLFATSCAAPRPLQEESEGSDHTFEVELGPILRPGQLIFVTLRLENGKSFECLVDTGSTSTEFPTSVEEELGAKVGERSFRNLHAGPFKERLYKAPRVFLGTNQLLLGETVGVSRDFGVLGVDCLRNYCLQFDFESRVLRFNPRSSATNAFGQKFALKNSRTTVIQSAGLLECASRVVLLDSGCQFDGYIAPSLFKDEDILLQGELIPVVGAHSSDYDSMSSVPVPYVFHDVKWEGNLYSDVILAIHPVKRARFDILGMKFIERHNVTIDYPEGVVWIKRIRP